MAMDILSCPFSLSKSSARILWEVTGRCNLNCRHCLYFEHGKQVSEDLTFEQMLAILDEISIDGSIRFLWLSGGEPLMRKDIVALCGEITKRGLVPSLSTNGTLLTEERAVTLYRAGVRYVHLSLDGADAPTHDYLRGTSGAFERTLQGMDYLYGAGIQTGASCMVTWNNVDDIPKVIRLGQRHHLSVLSFYLIAPIGRGQHTAYERELELMEKIEAVLTPYIEQSVPRIEVFRTLTREKITNPDMGLMKCRGNYFYTISNDGSLYACPWLAKGTHSVPSVSLLEASFAEARKVVSASMERYIEERIRLLDDHCSDCGRRVVCQQGCPAVSGIGNVDPLCRFLR